MTIVYIAGMHRSGTSLVARLLNLCGVCLGEEKDLVPAANDNPAGFWEHIRFQEINNELLNAFEGSWDYPPALNSGWEADPRLMDIRERASALFLEFSEQKVWGWKDPRNSLTYPFWKTLAPDAKIIYCLRNPYEVYQSLTRRGYSSNIFAYKLWTTYNEQLVSTTKSEKRIITHFDSFFFDHQSELRRLIDFLGLDVSDETIIHACETLSKKGRHTRASVNDLYETNAPQELLARYKNLCLQAGPIYHLSLSSEERLSIESIGLEEDDSSTLGKYARVLSALKLENRIKDKQINELTKQTNELTKQISSMKNLQDEIHNSYSWKVAGFVRRTHFFFMPQGSKREQIIHKLLGGWGKVRSVLKREGFRGIYLRIRNKPLSNRVNSYSRNNVVSSYSELLKASTNSGLDDFVDIAQENISANDEIIKLIAFYLPQFHPIPENDTWWGKGFTEWMNVSKAMPQFVGHYQPHLPGELGFYDLRIPEVQKRQIELAKKYGIHGFAFHYYWFNGKRLLEKPLDIFLDSKEDFPFCICWANENWTRRWDGQENEILIAQKHSPESDLRFIEDVAPILRDKRYININGRPLLIVYRANILPDVSQTVSIWREYCKSHGIGDPYLVAAQTFWFSDPREVDFDAAVEFPPHNMSMNNMIRRLKVTNPEYQGMVFDYKEIMEKSISIPKPDYKIFKTVFPGWDNEARKPGRGYTFAFSTPDLYKEWLLRASLKTMEEPDREKRLLFINAWNEWAEGAHLEPDRKYGYAYLQATADALKKIIDENGKVE